MMDQFDKMATDSPLRNSCTPCTLARRRCDVVPNDRCLRCQRHDISAEECVFEPARKRGPRGPRIRRSGAAHEEGGGSGSLDTRHGSHGGAAVRRTDTATSTSSIGSTSGIFSTLAHSTAFSDFLNISIPQPTSAGPSPPTSSGDLDSPPSQVGANLSPRPTGGLNAHIAPLPDASMLNLFMNRYLHSLYMSLPLTIRSEVCVELARGILPDFAAYSIMFWTLWFDRELAEQVGPQHPQLLRQLFHRVEVAIRPAIESTLAGCADSKSDEDVPDWVVDAAGRKRREYRYLAASVCMSMLHLINVALAFRDPTEEPYSDVRRLLELTIRVAKTAKLNSARFYRKPGGRSCAVSERARRAWWSLAIGDIQIAIMTGTQPKMRADESLEVGMQMAEPEFEEQKKTVEADLVLPLAEQSSPEMNEGSPEAALVFSNVLNNSFRPDGSLSHPHHHVRLFFLIAQAVEYRKSHKDVSSAGPGRDAILTNLERWFADLPKEAQALDLGRLPPETLYDADQVISINNDPSTVGGDLTQILATLLYTLVVYHTAHVILASPGGDLNETCLTGNTESIDWLRTPSFLVCQEHAIRATRLLQRFMGAGNAGHVAKPFFQYCVVRTGLVHLNYYKEMSLVADAAQLPLLSAASAQIEVHSAILYLGQAQTAPIGGEEDSGQPSQSRSHWYKVWLEALGNVPGSVVGTGGGAL